MTKVLAIGRHGFGMALADELGLPALADLGTRSSFDVVPTLLALTHAAPAWPVSGQAISIPASAG